MKYSVGYRIMEDNSLTDCIIKNKGSIDSVYFSWGNFPNGRNSQPLSLTLWEAMQRQTDDLSVLNKNGIKFNLLFNGNCYGADSLSRDFYSKIGDTCDYIKQKFNLYSVTTTSPLIGKFVKANFDDVKVISSVNMEIGTAQGMDYVADFFDGYYMKREYNRDFKKIRELSSWCSDNGKTLHMLANSGCLNYCSAHNFHDNLVSHEGEIAKRDNCYQFEGVCHTYLKNKDKRISLVRDTNFIRPEDIGLYEEYFKSVKLATRVSDNPAYIIESYIRKKCVGNILRILEPNHSGRIYPYVLDNQKLDNSCIFCDKNCSSCSRCKEIFDRALTDLSGITDIYE